MKGIDTLPEKLSELKLSPSEWGRQRMGSDLGKPLIYIVLPLKK